MTKQSLTLSGWLSCIFAATQIPTILLTVFAQDLAGVSGGRAIELMMNVISLVLYVFLNLQFKRFVNERFGFHQLDGLIIALNAANVVVVGVVTVAVFAPGLKGFSTGLAFASMIYFGVLGTVFGIRMLRLPDGLHGLLKPYAYTFIASSLMLGSIILIPFGLLAGVATSVILGMIFFRAAEDAETDAQAAALTGQPG